MNLKILSKIGLRLKSLEYLASIIFSFGRHFSGYNKKNKQSS